MTTDTIITATLNETQALAFAQFLKRVKLDDYKTCHWTKTRRTPCLKRVSWFAKLWQMLDMHHDKSRFNVFP